MWESKKIKKLQISNERRKEQIWLTDTVSDLKNQKKTKLTNLGLFFLG